MFSRSMWCMIKDTFKGSYNMSFLSGLVLVVGVLYVLFPFDIIGDMIPVLGWIDDGVAIFFIVKRLQWETQRYIRFKAMERKRS